MSEVVQEAQAELPKAHVLSYVAAVTTPTKVRRVAARASMILGIVQFIGGGIILLPVGVETVLIMVPSVVGWSMDGIYLAFESAAKYVAEPLNTLSQETGIPVNEIAFVAAISFAVLGLVEMLSACRVRRGAKAACILSCWLLWLFLAWTAIGTALLASISLLVGVWGQGRASSHAPLLLLLLVPVGVLLVLLVNDVCGYLLWIARNPIAEKPSVAFIKQ